MALAVWGSVVMVAVLSPLCAGVAIDANCSEEALSIAGGNYSLTAGLAMGSLLLYRCPQGYYPSPMSRRCLRRGRWSPPYNPKHPAECKRVTCPDPLVFENGEVFPIQSIYYVTNQTTYKCFDGYKQSGSESRVCQWNGKWSGSTPVCDRGSDHCHDPGIPPGARRTGVHFDIDDKVTYRCDQGLTLVGSKERVCLESGEWTGVPPACYADFTYDTPDEVSASFAASLRDSLTTGEDGGQHGNMLRLNKAGDLHIYIALDISDSIEKKEFGQAKMYARKLIERIQYFDVTPRYGVIAFATEVMEVINITQPRQEDLDLLKELEKLTYEGKTDKSGTNIAGAFEFIYERMSYLAAQMKENFLNVQHTIIMFTDGIANMGGNAETKVKKIRALVNVDDNRDDFLDIYVFGIGRDINMEVIDKLVSKKVKPHFFKLDSGESMEEMLDKMIDEGDKVGLCGIYRDYGEKLSTNIKRSKHPWVAKIEIVRDKSEKCMGSLVSRRFVLTAAHCFKLTDKAESITVTIDDGTPNKAKAIEKYIPHPRYDSRQKEQQGIKEFYDYDVALIQLKEDVVMSVKARPICIPCTKETNQALKLPDNAKCEQHKDLLLKKETEPAEFMDALQLENRYVTIKLGKNRDSCISDVVHVPKEIGNITNPEDMVTKNFLCTGGIDENTDDFTCRGDSGGPLILQRRKRLIQVGIISFGVKNACIHGKRIAEPDAISRDFHINVFSILDFIKPYLSDENFVPVKFID